MQKHTLRLAASLALLASVYFIYTNSYMLWGGGLFIPFLTPSNAVMIGLVAVEVMTALLAIAAFTAPLKFKVAFRVALGVLIVGLLAIHMSGVVEPLLFPSIYASALVVLVLAGVLSLWPPRMASQQR